MHTQPPAATITNKSVLFSSNHYLKVWATVLNVKASTVVCFEVYKIRISTYYFVIHFCSFVLNRDVKAQY